MRISGFAATDTGLLRDENEDSLHCGSTFFVVADGIGGQNAGEVASALAVDRLAVLDGASFDDVDASRKALSAAVADANGAVLRKGQERPEYYGMGTTLTAALVVGDRWLQLAHVGDSRAYLFRPGEALYPLTRDHTLVAELVRSGRLTPEAAAQHPRRSMITRALGLEPDLAVDLPPPVELRAGDQTLLCSDGLTDAVGDDRISEVLATHDDGDAACAALVTAAIDAGGPDNVTVVLLRAG